MKNTFGNRITLTLFGESHGPAIGAVLDGIPAGLAVNTDSIAQKLARRRPQSAIDTPRCEQDNFQILSGVYQGKTTGAPLCIVIPNENTKSGDYTYGIARPSHADYTAFCKYHANEDFRGGGHFSGRLTAAIVAVCAILQDALAACGIAIGTHILQCGSVSDRAFGDVVSDIALLQNRAFPTLEADAQDAITAEILAAREAKDSVGGKTQTAICGLPRGLGEPFFDSVESQLSHALFSIGGIKGVEFGAGFALCAMRGSEANDPLAIQDGNIVTVTNRAGGINGGITNGMPIVFQCAVRPTPSIAKEQNTVNFVTMEETTLAVRGRHDPAIVRRICPVIDALCALVVCDLLAETYGTDALAKGLPL